MQNPVTATLGVTAVLTAGLTMNALGQRGAAPQRTPAAPRPASGYTGARTPDGKPDLNGIWAANDNMGLGALDALRTAGKQGQILACGIDGTSEAIQACIDKEFAATVNNDPMWQGGMGLSLPYSAMTGVFDPAAEPHEHREFYFEPVFVNMENAAEIKATYIEGTPEYDWNDLWGRVQGE